MLEVCTSLIHYYEKDLFVIEHHCVSYRFRPDGPEKCGGIREG